MEQGSRGLPGGSGPLEGTSPSFDLSRAELGSEGPILVPWLGDTLGGALLAGSTPNVGRRAPSACFCAEAPALPRRVPAGGRPAGVTHDVTDNDTSRVSQSDTAPELHNVTLGMLRPWH